MPYLSVKDLNDFNLVDDRKKVLHKKSFHFIKVNLCFYFLNSQMNKLQIGGFAVFKREKFIFKLKKNSLIKVKYHLANLEKVKLPVYELFVQKESYF